MHNAGRCACAAGWLGAACDRAVDCGRTIHASRLDAHASANCGGDTRLGGDNCRASCALGYSTNTAIFVCGTDGKPQRAV